MQIETQAETIAQFASYLDELSLQHTTLKYRREATQRLHRFQAYIDDQPVSVYLAKKFLAHLRDQGYKPATLQAYYFAIKPFLEFIGIPFKMKLHTPRPLPSYHAPEEISSMLHIVGSRTDSWAKLKQRDALIILLLALTGLRESEALSLRPCDISGGYIRVRHGKRDKDRAIPLARDLVKPLQDYIARENIDPTDRLFSISVKQFYNIVKKYAMSASIPDLSPHTLRHYFATALVERGAQLKAVQQLLGHTRIETTAIYLDLVPSHLKSSIALLDESVSISLGTRREKRNEEQQEQENRQLHPVLVRPQSHGNHRGTSPIKALRPRAQNRALHNETDGRLPEKRGSDSTRLLRPQDRYRQRPHIAHTGTTQEAEYHQCRAGETANLLGQPTLPVEKTGIRRKWREPVAGFGEKSRQKWREPATL